MAKVKLLKLNCKRCGHKWTPRKKEVITCPKCKSPYWNKNRINPLLTILFLLICVTAHADTASWYSVESCQREGTSGVWTASGEAFTNEGLTCAMRSRDFGKYYKVTNLENNKSVIVRHNDFGPNKTLWKQGRVIDLSKGAFSKISNLDKGLIKVKVERK